MKTIRDLLHEIDKKLDRILNIYEGFVTNDIEEEIVFVDEQQKYLCSIDDIPSEIATLPKFTKFIMDNLQDTRIVLKDVSNKNDVILLLGRMFRE